MQPSSNTFLAVVTTVATLVGAVGGLIATVYAVGITDNGNAASTPTPAPVATSTNTAAPTRAPTPSPSPPGSPTPVVVAIAPDADRWWGPPGSSSGDQDNEGGEDGPGQTEALSLSWGCNDGRGSHKDCGSGLIAIHFDLSDLPDGISVDEAALTLYRREGGHETKVFALPANSGWSETDSDSPSCDSSDQTSAEAADDEWNWDVTPLVRDQLTGDTENFGLCLLLSDNDDAVIFGSRESADSLAPSLTVTYTAHQ